MKLFARQRFLAIYSGVLTLVFAVTVICGFAAPRNETFDQITVHRINFVEPDGTPRLIISDRAEFPGAYVHGKEHPRPDRSEAAGMLFMNDEGTENGGMLWGGLKDKSGKIENYGHLSFDKYDQDQIFAIDSGQDADEKSSAIRISDRGDYPIQEAVDAKDRIEKLPQAQRKAEWDKFFATHTGDANRIYLGRAPDKSASLRIKDEQGRDRLVMRVNAEGNPVIQFLDDSGNVTREFTGTN
ncbi:MAG: hypothetical protein WA658_21535 [Candidatus Acidiferrales bacterium]